MTKTHLKAQELYDENYYKKHCGELPYERSEHWINFFGGIARRIADDFQPQTTLDAGCAIGLLVEALQQNGVEAYGFDVSEWAIKQMPSRYARFVKKDSILNSKAFEKKFDLVTCIEVLEHLQPSEADIAVENLCSWGNIVIFTSSPDDYAETTHFNVQQPGYWAEKFAQNGFVRVLNYNAGYIASWAQVFRRETIILPALVRQYEDNLWVKTKQIYSQREAVVKLQQNLDVQTDLTESSQTAAIAALAAEKEIAELRLQKEIAERERVDIERNRLSEELENLKSLEANYAALRESHLDLQNDFSAIKRELTNLQSDSLSLQKSYAVSNDERSRLLKELQSVNEMIDKVFRTKSWKAVNFWWKSKEKVVSFLPRKRDRFRALYKTASYIQRNQGSGALASRSLRFLKGERLNANFSPSVEITRKLNEEEFYHEWIIRNEPDAVELNGQKQHEIKFKYRPLISILTPIFNTDEVFLEKMVESVLAQTYSNWELCLADGNSTALSIRPSLEKYARLDHRIKVKFLDKNFGISGNSNEALAMATGEFVALLDHDDTLTPNALYENVALLNRNPQADMIYSDEDKLNPQGKRCSPFFKPDWSPDLLRSIMYTCHLGIYRTELVKQVGDFRPAFDGSQDYDLVLRLIEKTDQIFHIPKILYQWRMSPESTALSADAKDYAETARVKALQEHCERTGVKGIAKPGLFNSAVRLKYLPEEHPLISIIIPTRDKVEVLRQCVNSILKLSTYQNYEILIVDNDSREQATFNYFDSLEKHSKIRLLNYSGKFNFSAINNFAVNKACGEIMVFLNNDTEVISPDWLEAMLEHALREDVGAVGARLIYPNKTIQHAGVVIGIGGVAGHVHLGISQGDVGYFGRALMVQNFSAVTGACLMTKAKDFKEVGGFNERSLAVAFNDIDYCLKLREKDLLVIYTPYAELYHYESLSRGSDSTPENIDRFRGEMEYMQKTWSATIENDPYYNPNLSLDMADGSFAISLTPRHKEISKLQESILA